MIIFAPSPSVVRGSPSLTHLWRLFRSRSFAALDGSISLCGCPVPIFTALTATPGFYYEVTLEAWGGSLTVESKARVGTTVTLVLDKAQPPVWFVPELKFSRGMTVVVVDDDISIHQIWQKRLESAGDEFGISLLHFSTIDDLESWHKSKKHRKVLHLIDYELIGQPKSGLEIIELLGIQKTSLLVTSRYEEEGVLAECLRLGVRMIPKTLAGSVPIRMPSSTGSKRVDYVLIDDDPITRLSWKASAEDHKKALRTYPSPKRFFASALTLARETPVYIDSNLGSGVRGEEVAKQIRGMGFENIYLATGYSPEKFVSMPWLKDIVGKEPPWTGRNFGGSQ